MHPTFSVPHSLYSSLRGVAPIVPTLTIAAVLLLAIPVRADQVVLAGTNFPGAKIAGLQDGRLRFLTAGGDLETPWISDVEWMVVDRGDGFADFNRAEQYLADGEPEQAIERYRRAARTLDGFWRELIDARLLLACTRAGRWYNATLAYVEVVRGAATGPAVAARLLPVPQSAGRDKEILRNIKLVHDALVDEGEVDRRAMFQLLRYELLREANDERAASAAAEVAALEVPVVARTQQVYAVKLAALETVLDAGGRGLAAADAPSGVASDAAAWDGLDRAIRYCPEEHLPAFLLLKGRAMLGRAQTWEDLIRAGWSFMRVAIHMGDDPQAAEGLYHAADVLERIGRTDKALALLQECRAHPRAGEEVRRAAQSAIARLQAKAAVP